MRIWVVNQYAVRPDQAGGTRHFALAREWTRMGHEVVIIASSFNHFTRRETGLAGRSGLAVQELEGVRFVWLKTPTYGDHPLSRARSMLSFASRVRMARLKQRLGRPDVIVGSSPSLFAAAAARSLARLHGAAFVLEIRDLWPKSLVEVEGMGLRHPVVRALGGLESRLYRTADRIVTLLPNATSYIEARGRTRAPVTWVPNGVDLSTVTAPALPNMGADFTVAYVGSHGKANALDTVIEAAAHLANEDQGRSVLFRLIGDGPEKPRLRMHAESLGLTNILFEDAVPRGVVFSKLQEAHALIVVLRKSGLYEYGISLNKLFDYLAAARPIVMSGDAGNDPVREAGAGLTVPAEDPEAVANAIRQLQSLSPERRHAMGLRGRRYLEQNHDLSELARTFASVMDEAWSDSSRTPLVKRTLDLVGAGFALVACSLPMLAIAAGIRATLGSPILFRQTRPGLRGRPFEIYKFRTMRNAVDAEGDVLDDEKRLTRFGGILRRTSLDELPELFNVLKGDMSLVGPRPLLMEYLDRYTPEQARRHEVKPGLTGWAQVNGRNDLSWEDKLALDVWYVDHRSLRLDLRIMLMTVGQVLSGRGISAEGHVTAPRFMGPADS